MKLIPKRGTEMRLTKSFTADCLKENQKIIIYGAGRYGELALRGLQHLGLQPSYSRYGIYGSKSNQSK